MAILKIRKLGDPVLRSNAKKVNEINEKTRELLKNMADTMYDAPGIGLAAPQVGVLQRIVVVDVDDENGLIELINPEIVSSSEEKDIFEEGCLSVPEQTAEVIRPSKIRVKALDRNAKEIEFDAHGLLARAIQHELDHLEGVLFIDKV
ncbi:peptide deformylase [Natronospora cellulosivora (SeqCode)]